MATATPDNEDRRLHIVLTADEFRDYKARVEQGATPLAALLEVVPRGDTLRLSLAARVIYS